MGVREHASMHEDMHVFPIVAYDDTCKFFYCVVGESPDQNHFLVEKRKIMLIEIRCVEVTRLRNTSH